MKNLKRISVTRGRNNNYYTLYFETLKRRWTKTVERLTPEQTLFCCYGKVEHESRNMKRGTVTTIFIAE